MSDITARFTSDFSSFYDAVRTADAQLKTFGEGADRVGERLNKMSNTLSGRKLVQDATILSEAVRDIGGVAALTDAELVKVGATIAAASEKMRVLKMTVPDSFKEIEDAAAKATKSSQSWTASLSDVGTLVKGFLGLQVVQSVIGFGKEILTDADALQRMSAQTKVSTDWLQRFRVATDDAGGSVEDVTGAIFKMQERFGSNDKTARAALDTLKIGFGDIKNLRPEEQFVRIADALRDIDDPTQRAALGADIFGKSFINILPIIMRGFDDVKDAAVGMSSATVKSLADMNSEMSKFWRDVKAQGGEIIVLFSKLLPRALDAAGILTGQTFARAVKQAEDLKKLNKDIDGQLSEMARKQGKGAGPGMPAGLPAIAPPMDYEVREMERQTEKLIAVRTKDAEATAKQTKANEDAKQSIVAVEGVSAMFAGQIRSNMTLFGQAADQQKGWIRWLEQAEKDNADIGAKIRAMSAATIQRDVKDTSDFYDTQFEYLKKLPDAFMGPVQQVRGEWGKFSDFMTTALPQQILASITGGGNVLKGIGGTIGNYLLDPKQSGIGKSIADGASKLPGIIGGAVGSVLPMAGALIGPAIEGISKLFGKMFGSEKKEVNRTREEFVQMAGGLDALNLKAITAGVTLDDLLGAKKKATYEAAVNDLTKAFEFQSTALDEVRATAEKYGFTLSEMGTAMAKGELDKQAQQLFRDFTILNQAMFDTNAITERMSASVSEYVNNAVAMGIEVPSAMRPMLQTFVDAGKLLDAQGNAITNLEDSGVSFALTMSEGFRMMVDEVKRLTDAIARGLGVAINNVPQPQIKGRVSWDVDTVPTPPPGARMPSYADGSDGFRNFGAGTPVMLHGWEAVVPRGDDPSAALLAGPVAAGGGGGVDAVTIIVNAQGAYFDTPGDLQRLADKVSTALTAKYSVMSKLRAAV